MSTKALNKTLGIITLLLGTSLLTGCAMKSGSPYAEIEKRYGNGETANGGIGKGTLRRVYFGFDQANIRSDDQKNLKYNAQRMKKDNKLVVLVEGHTDKRGGEEYNIALGEQRARAAQKYMLDSGVSGNRIRVKSWGEEKLLSQGAGKVDHAANRRAEFVVLENGKKELN